MLFHLHVCVAKATAGRPSALWVGLAQLYEAHHQLDDARVVFEKATGVSFTHVEDLAAIWCEWAEMELRHEYVGRSYAINCAYPFLL